LCNGQNNWHGIHLARRLSQPPAELIPTGIRKSEMKLFLKSVHLSFYFGVGKLIAIPSACDLLTGIPFGDVESLIKGITGSVIASYLLFCVLVINPGGVTLLETRKVQRIAFSVLAIFSAGFLSDISTTLQLVL
jgi:hypothetical protein